MSNISNALAGGDVTTQIIQGLAESSLIAEDTNYTIWAILVINILLFLERVFKNTKFAVRCSKNGCFMGNRTPPHSLSNSAENIPAMDAKKLAAALKDIREDIAEINRSLSGDSNERPLPGLRQKRRNWRGEWESRESSTYDGSEADSERTVYADEGVIRKKRDPKTPPPSRETRPGSIADKE